MELNGEIWQRDNQKGSQEFEIKRCFHDITFLSLLRCITSVHLLKEQYVMLVRSILLSICATFLASSARQAP
jgi:hypothetical protein